MSDNIDVPIGEEIPIEVNIKKDKSNDVSLEPKKLSKKISKKEKELIKKNEEMKTVRKEIEEVSGISTSMLRDSELAIPLSIARYMRDMKPTAIMNGKIGAKHQKKLRKTFIDLLEVDGERFQIIMDWTIDAITLSRINNGAFSDRYVMRFVSMIDLLPTQLNLYKRLLNLFLVTADINDKRLIKSRVDISYIINSITSPEIQNKILRYYS